MYYLGGGGTSNLYNLPAIRQVSGQVVSFVLLFREYDAMRYPIANLHNALMGTGTIFPIFLCSNFSLDAPRYAKSFRDDD